MSGRGENVNEARLSSQRERLPALCAPPQAPCSLEEEIARLSIERQRLLLAQRLGRIGTFEWDVSAEQVSWTPELEALYGLPPGGFAGGYESWMRCVHPEDLAQAEESWRQASRGEAPRETEFRVIWPDGSTHWLLATGKLQCDDARLRGKVIGVNIDITERKKVEEQLALQTALLQMARQDLHNLHSDLEAIVIQRTREYLDSAETQRQLNAHLQRSNQELHDFAHVASHDLQEPLRKIQAFGNLLEEEYGQTLGEGKAYLDRIRRAAARMQRLITDLLTFAQVTSRAQLWREIDLNTIIQEVIDDLEASVHAQRGEIDVAHLPTIRADPGQMRQVFQNLIGNALKFHRPGVPPAVKIWAEGSSVISEDACLRPQTWTICVADNGIGFDEQHLERMFTVFQRLHGKGQYEGTGIGLAVVRKIIAHHNGRVTAHSTPGEGSTFLIVLPVTEYGE